jgi:hypothetical protein
LAISGLSVAIGAIQSGDDTPGRGRETRGSFG